MSLCPITSVRPQNFFIFPNWNSVSSPSPTMDTVLLLSVSMNLFWVHTMFILLWLAYFTLSNVPKVHPCCSACQNFLPFYGWWLFHCMCLPHFVQLFIHWWTRELPFGCYEYMLLWMYGCLLESLLSLLLGVYPKVELLGYVATLGLIIFWGCAKELEYWLRGTGGLLMDLKQGVPDQIVILKGYLGSVVPGVGKERAGRCCGGQVRQGDPLA